MSKIQKLVLVLASGLLLFVGGNCRAVNGAEKPNTELEKALKTIPFVETDNNPQAIGDKVDKHGKPRPPSKWAYGDRQIRNTAVSDFNKAHKTEYKAEQMLGNPTLSEIVCRGYLQIVCNKKILGREPTLCDYLVAWRGPARLGKPLLPIDRDRLRKAEKALGATSK